MTATEMVVWGWCAHFAADWLLQNEYQALNKVSLRHPAAYLHSGIHGVLLALVFPWPVALALAVIHLLVDTRRPLQWWRRSIRQTTEGPMAVHVAIWGDQVVHLLTIAAAAALVGRTG